MRLTSAGAVFEDYVMLRTVAEFIEA